MNNIGSVYYKKSSEPGTLDAVWSHSTDGYGNGIATGGPLEGFEGDYKIKYFDHEGKTVAERDLKIVGKGDCYELYWIKNGKVMAEGYGVEAGGILAAGWQNKI